MFVIRLINIYNVYVTYRLVCGFFMMLAMYIRFGMLVLLVIAYPSGVLLLIVYAMACVILYAISKLIACYEFDQTMYVVVKSY